MSVIKKTSVKKEIKIVKRSVPKVTGIFIDGISLDRATRRINRKVEISKLVKSLSGGLKPTVCRYYTIIPFEDDSRHHSYLDAIQRAGVDVIIKRLPPKGMEKQVDVYPEMAADLLAFALGHYNFSGLSRLESYGEDTWNREDEDKNQELMTNFPENIKRVATIVCPARALTYPISLISELKVDTISADFREMAGNDVLKGSAKWIDLSDSELIWRE